MAFLCQQYRTAKQNYQQIRTVSPEISDKRLRIIWVGRLEQHQKRVRDLVEIVEHLTCHSKKFQLIIAGTGPEEQWLKDRLEFYVQEGMVVFKGLVDPDAMQTQIYNRADVLLLTSLWETGPIVIWEAMAAGVAVVSTRYIGSGREGALRHEENCLLFPVGDTAKAARQLHRMGDINLRTALCRKGRNLVRQRYSTVSVEAWDKAYVP